MWFLIRIISPDGVEEIIQLQASNANAARQIASLRRPESRVRVQGGGNPNPFIDPNTKAVVPVITGEQPGVPNPAISATPVRAGEIGRPEEEREELFQSFVSGLGARGIDFGGFEGTQAQQFLRNQFSPAIATFRGRQALSGALGERVDPLAFQRFVGETPIPEQRRLAGQTFQDIINLVTQQRAARGGAAAGVAGNLAQQDPTLLRQFTSPDAEQAFRLVALANAAIEARFGPTVSRSLKFDDPQALLGQFRSERQPKGGDFATYLDTLSGLGRQFSLA